MTLFGRPSTVTVSGRACIAITDWVSLTNLFPQPCQSSDTLCSSSSTSIWVRVRPSVRPPVRTPTAAILSRRQRHATCEGGKGEVLGLFLHLWSDPTEFDPRIKLMVLGWQNNTSNQQHFWEMSCWLVALWKRLPCKYALPVGAVKASILHSTSLCSQSRRFINVHCSQSTMPASRHCICPIQDFI